MRTKVTLTAIALSMILVNVVAQTWQPVGAQGFSPPVDYTSLALDHNGTPYVAFSDKSDTDKLTVMKFNGTSWADVGNADFSPGKAYDISIAIDNNNVPYVAYGDVANSSHTTVVKFNGTNWVVVGTPGFSTGVINNCTIRFDSNNVPYVAYVDASYSGKAVVQKFNGTNWVNVGTAGFTAGGTGQMTMALSASNLPYVGYQDQANGFAESVMMYNGSSWVHVGASTFSNGTCQFTHITFDSTGTVPYVCYNEGFNPFAPNVQMFNGSSWQYVGGQNLNTDVDYQNNITVAGNTPYVLLPDGSYAGKATVAKYNGSSWVTVGNAGFSMGFTEYPNILIDATGGIYAEYYDDGNSEKISVMKFGGSVTRVIAFTGSDSVICQNLAVTFTDQSTGSPVGRNWTFAGGTPGTSTSQNPVIHYDTTGTFTVKLVVSYTGATDSLTKAGYVTVIPSTVAGTVTGPGSVCQGDSVTLINTGSTGSIQWQSSVDGISFSDLPADTSGNYNNNALTQTTWYRIQASGYCGQDSSNLAKVVVNPLPAPLISTTDSIICSGDSTHICSSTPFASYRWNTNDTTSCMVAGEAGGYWLTVTDANGCSAISAHQIINAYPVSSVSISIEGDTLSSAIYNVYQWIINDTIIPGATSIIYVPYRSGNYAVQITDSNGCTALSGSISEVINGISDMGTIGKISIYPDPFVTTLFIETGNSVRGIENINIYDALGKLIFDENTADSPNTLLKIDASLWPNGTYYVTAKSAAVNNYYRQIIKLSAKN